MMHNNVDSLTAYRIDCRDMDDTTAGWFTELIRSHSHDINGRIMSLKLNLYLMEKQTSDPKLKSLLDRMNTEINDLTGMVENLSDNSTPCDQQ